mgnify:CR=1 FL=1
MPWTLLNPFAPMAPAGFLEQEFAHAGEVDVCGGGSAGSQCDGSESLDHLYLLVNYYIVVMCMHKNILN